MSGIEKESQTDFSMKNQFRRALSWKNPFQAINYLKLLMDSVVANVGGGVWEF